jgi:hypothetical protein
VQQRTSHIYAIILWVRGRIDCGIFDTVVLPVGSFNVSDAV